MKQLFQIENNIRTLEIALENKTSICRITNMCTNKAEAAMARTRYHYYEFGNKTVFASNKTGKLQQIFRKPKRYKSRI